MIMHFSVALPWGFVRTNSDIILNLAVIHEG